VFVCFLNSWRPTTVRIGWRIKTEAFNHLADNYGSALPVVARDLRVHYVREWCSL
jgi:hypothetical protein